MLPYSMGIRRLDKLYLDTTFAKKRDICRTFPSKADGLKELLLKVSEYPQRTTFYLNAWTFGYEEVYLALASMLGSKVCNSLVKFFTSNSALFRYTWIRTS